MPCKIDTLFLDGDDERHNDDLIKPTSRREWYELQMAATHAASLLFKGYFLFTS